jgi:hypothetical protein
MSPIDIDVGKKYTDGKGNVREVIAEGERYVLYFGQWDRDCVRYRVIAGRSRVGQECNASRSSFAAWARVEVAGAGSGRPKG